MPINIDTNFDSLAAILEKNAQPSDIIYHYTNWKGLKGILTNQKLWLTDVTQLNDTSELKYAINIITKYIENHEEIAGDTKTRLIKQMDILKKITTNFVNFYTISFCLEKNYLYAWRAYANDGKGYAIGFKPGFFEGFQKNNEAKFGKNKVYYYIKEPLISYIEKLINEVNVNLGNKQGRLGSLRSKEDIAADFTAEVALLLTSLKHPAFKDEKEYRLFHYSLENYEVQKFTSTCNSCKFSTQRRIWLNFDLDNIVEIWVGPQLNYHNEAKKIKKILTSLEKIAPQVNSIKICPSDIPYKNNYIVDS